MAEPLITFVLCFYNEEDYLAETLASLAAQAIEAILATPVNWQPSLVDAATGATVEGAASVPIAPDFKSNSQQALLQGQLKSPYTLALWLPDQHPSLQRLGWSHLGQSLGQVFPDLSRHWTHSQWHYLQAHIASPEKASHAA